MVAPIVAQNLERDVGGGGDEGDSSMDWAQAEISAQNAAVNSRPPKGS